MEENEIKSSEQINRIMQALSDINDKISANIDVTSPTGAVAPSQSLPQNFQAALNPVFEKYDEKDDDNAGGSGPDNG